MSISVPNPELDIRQTAEIPVEQNERLTGLIERASLPEAYHDSAFQAMQHYVDGDGYHVRDHMFDVATNFLDTAEKEELDQADLHAGFLAALWHDADYLLTSDVGEQKSYSSKEHKAAHLAFISLYRVTLPDAQQGTEAEYENWRFAGRVADLVLSTEAGRDTTGDRVKILLNEADLYRVGHSITDALKGAGKIFLEQKNAQALEAGESTFKSVAEAINNNLDDLTPWCKMAKTAIRELISGKDLDPRLAGNLHRLTPANLLRYFKNNQD